MHKIRNTAHLAILQWFQSWAFSEHNYTISKRNALAFCSRNNWDKPTIIRQFDKGWYDAMIYQD